MGQIRVHSSDADRLLLIVCFHFQFGMGLKNYQSFAGGSLKCSCTRCLADLLSWWAEPGGRHWNAVRWGMTGFMSQISLFLNQALTPSVHLRSEAGIRWVPVVWKEPAHIQTKVFWKVCKDAYHLSKDQPQLKNGNALSKKGIICDVTGNVVDLR